MGWDRSTWFKSVLGSWLKWALVLGSGVFLNSGNVYAQQGEQGDEKSTGAVEPEAVAGEKDKAAPAQTQTEVKDHVKENVQQPGDESRGEPQQSAAKGEESKEFLLKPTGEGEVLPENFWRAWVYNFLAEGDSGFDQKGNKMDWGWKVSAAGSVFGVEYGVSKSTTLQIAIPYIRTNNLGLDADKFVASHDYADNYEITKAGLSTLMQQQGICANDTACRALIDAGYALPADQDVVLSTTGETVHVKAGVPFKQYMDTLVRHGAQPTKGETGLGDITLGLLTNIYKDPRYMFSSGLGLRLPTGSFTDVTRSRRATGAGFTTLGVRFNFDYWPTDYLTVGIQNLSEYDVTKTKKKRTSDVNPDNLNQGDPMNGGDGHPNVETVETKGVANFGKISAKLNPQFFIPAIDFMVLSAAYNWNFDVEWFLGGRSQGGAQHSTQGNYGLTVHGFNYKIPLALTLERTSYLSGKNVDVAVINSSATVTAYAKF
jgi:hypothetical protein